MPNVLSETRRYSVGSSQVVVRPGGSSGGGTRLRMQTGETLVHLRRGRSPGRSVLPIARVTNARNLSDSDPQPTDVGRASSLVRNSIIITIVYISRVKFHHRVGRESVFRCSTVISILAQVVASIDTETATFASVRYE